MLRLSKLAVLLTLLCPILLHPAPSPAQGFRRTDEQEIRNFRLTENFLTRYKAVLDDELKAETPAAPISPREENGGLSPSVALFARDLSQDSAQYVLLEKHGLQPKETVLGMIVLVRAACGDAVPQKFLRGGKRQDDLVNPSNLVFYRAHKDQISAMLDEFIEEP